jgi:LemA protein
MSAELWIVVAVVVGLVVAFIVVRNTMIEGRNRVDEAWSGVDVQLKRRHDLVPNLVETVKAYAQHEQTVLERTTQARADAMRALGSSPAAEAEAEAALSGALSGVRAVAENYPELRATENFQRLQRDLSEIEDEIQASRRIYNSNAQAYNTRIQVFPNSIVATIGGLTPREYFEIVDASEREPTEVAFS